MAESKELMESQTLHEVASGIAEDENLSEQLAEVVLSSVSSLVDRTNTDDAHAGQTLLGKGNTAISYSTLYITNVHGEYKDGLQTPLVAEVDSISPLSNPVHEPAEVQDGEKYQRRQEQETSRVRDPKVGSASPSLDELRGITLGDDIEGEVEKFDAYVCYCQEDLRFVNKMKKKLEGEYNLKLCIDERDIVPGGCDVSVKAELIKNRCRRMMVILSPEFLKVPKSDANNFCYKFAVSLEPGAESRKVIPVIVSPCEVPAIMFPLTKCDYTKKDLREYFWPRLHKAIVNPP